MKEAPIVAVFPDPDQARQAAELLREADIDVELDEPEPTGEESNGEHDGGGGVLLRVSQEDEAQARTLLDEEHGEQLTPEDPFSETDPEEEEQWEEMTEGMHCPSCGGKELGLGTLVFQAVGTAVVISFTAVFLLPDAYRAYGIGAWGILLLGFLYGLGTRRFPLVCKECGYTGKRREFDPTTD